MANRASSRRVETPVLSNTLDRWRLTVSSLIENWVAISRLLHPSTTRRLQRLNDLVHGNGAGEKDDLYPRRLGHDCPHGFQAGEPRHQDVEQEDVGFEFESLGDGIVAILGLTDDFEAGLVLEHVSDTEADYGVIVGDDDPYGGHATGGSGLLCGLLTHCAKPRTHVGWGCFASDS